MEKKLFLGLVFLILIYGTVFSQNRLAHTTWETITEYGTRHTINFGESGFRWSIASNNRVNIEVGTYKIQGEMVYLSVSVNNILIAEHTYTGIFLENTLSISGGGSGWEFRRVQSDSPPQDSSTSSTGHSDSVNSVVFSPDGRQILSGSSDGTVKLWDTATGHEIRTFSGHSDVVYSVAFNPDGRQILSGSSDGTVKLWDTATGRIIRTFTNSDAVTSVAFSPDGKQILSGGNTIKLWDITTGREIRTLSNLAFAVSSVTFRPDGKQIVSGLYRVPIKLWDTITGREIRTFSDNSSYAKSVMFSPDGSLIIFGSGYTVKLWDATTGNEIMTFSGHIRSVESICFSPDGRYVLSGSVDTTIKLWDVVTGRLIRTIGTEQEISER
jgi:WD40 repeat protein